MPVFVPTTPDPRLVKLLAQYPPALFNDNFYQSCELVDRYCLDLAIKLVKQLGLPAYLVQPCTAETLLPQLGFDPQFRIALHWLLCRLASAKLLFTPNNGVGPTFRLIDPLREPELEELRNIGLAIDPANANTLDLLDAAAAVYPTVAQGDASGEQALFGSGQMDLWLSYFSNDNPLYAVNNWVSAIAAANRLEDLRSIHILEVGAGAGSATDALLSVLKRRGLITRIERYLVTEPNPFFRRRAERSLKGAYREVPLEFAGLDIDHPWADQGASTQRFHLVYGVNSLHVANDLLFSLNQARQCLSPRGWTVIGECLRPLPGQPIWAELVFQILDSFISVRTDESFRPTPGFLTTEQWQRALTLAQFKHVEIEPEQNRIREIYARFFTGAVCARSG